MSEHYGEIVEKVIRRGGHSLTEVAKITGVNRRSVYNWFLQPRLKPEVIIKIGRAIKHDFSAELPNEFVSDDFIVDLRADSPIYAGMGKVNVWKEKYIDLLERYNFLLTEKLDNPSIDLDRRFNILFVDEKCNEYKIDLKNPPSDLFLEKCKKAGYKIKCVNRAEVAKDRINKFTEKSDAQTKCLNC